MVEGWLVVLSLGVTLTLLSLMRDRFFSLLGRGWLFRVYAAPGVFIHELSHALTAILVGFNITHISFFSPSRTAPSVLCSTSIDLLLSALYCASSLVLRRYSVVYSLCAY